MKALSAKVTWKSCSIVVAAVALVASSGAAARFDATPHGKARSAYASFKDVKGDGAGAPDIVEVQVKHDAASVEFGFVVDGDIYPGPVTDYVVYLDIDPASVNHTVDHYIRFERQPDNNALALFRWNGTEFVEVPSPKGLGAFTGGRTDLSFRLSRAAIPEVTKFRFYVLTEKRDAAGQVQAKDTAPAAPLYWTYTFPALKLNVGAVKRAPARPSAGKAFTVSLPLTRTDTGEAPSKAKVTCGASVGGKPVQARGLLVKGNAACSLTVPKGSKRTLVVKLTVEVEGIKLTRSVSTKIA